MNSYKLLVALVTLAVVVGEFAEGEKSVELRLSRKKRATVKEVVSFVEFIFGVSKNAINVTKEINAFYGSITDAKWATMDFGMTNYCKWKLIDLEFFRFQGNIKDDNFEVVTIKPGELVPVSIGGHQTSGFTGTEGAMFFDVEQDWQCFFYWRVPDAFVVTKHNRLGMGCYNQTQFESKQKEIKAYLKAPTGKTSLPLRLHTNNDEIFIVRYCGDESVQLPFCIEGRISYSHKCKGYINLFPKKVADVAEPLKGEITQEEIDGRIKKTRKDVNNGAQGRTIAERFFIEVVVFFTISVTAAW